MPLKNKWLALVMHHMKLPENFFFLTFNIISFITSLSLKIRCYEGYIIKVRNVRTIWLEVSVETIWLGLSFQIKKVNKLYVVGNCHHIMGTLLSYKTVSNIVYCHLTSCEPLLCHYASAAWAVVEWKKGIIKHMKKSRVLRQQSIKE